MLQDNISNCRSPSVRSNYNIFHGTCSSHPLRPSGKILQNTFDPPQAPLSTTIMDLLATTRTAAQAVIRRGAGIHSGGGTFHRSVEIDATERILIFTSLRVERNSAYAVWPPVDYAVFIKALVVCLSLSSSYLFKLALVY